MAPSLCFLLSLWVLGLSWFMLAQSVLPGCAQPCLLVAFETNVCSPINTTCVCTNAEFQASVTKCVFASCTIPDRLATKNYSLTSCGTPVEDRGPRYAILFNVLFSTAAGFVVVRFAFKIFVSRMEIGADDWAVLATTIMSSASAIVTIQGTVKHGLGQHIWALAPEEITMMLKSSYVMAALYFTEIALLKLCLVFLYIRVFPSKGVRRLLWGTVIFVVAWGFTFVIAGIFQCQPIRFFWEHWDGPHEGHCADINAITNSHAAVSIILDIWILGIPLWQLWGLKMHWKKKVGVALMFCVGTFVTVVSILRLRALISFSVSDDPSWEFYDVSAWSTIEICVGIMCACLPTIRQLLAKLFPIINGSSYRSRQKYYNYDESRELQKIGRSQTSHDVRVATSGSSLNTENISPELKAEDGIMVQTSYTIKHSGQSTDEVSLVSHKDYQKS